MSEADELREKVVYWAASYIRLHTDRDPTFEELTLLCACVDASLRYAYANPELAERAGQRLEESDPITGKTWRIGDLVSTLLES